jgi:hypothetical protein
MNKIHESLKNAWDVIVFFQRRVPGFFSWPPALPETEKHKFLDPASGSSDDDSAAGSDDGGTPSSHALRAGAVSPNPSLTLSACNLDPFRT